MQCFSKSTRLGVAELQHVERFDKQTHHSKHSRTNWKPTDSCSSPLEEKLERSPPARCWQSPWPCDQPPAEAEL